MQECFNPHLHSPKVVLLSTYYLASKVQLTWHIWCSSRYICCSDVFPEPLRVYLMLFRIWLNPSDAFPDVLSFWCFSRILYVRIWCFSGYVHRSDVLPELVPVHSMLFWMFRIYLQIYFNAHPMFFWMSLMYLWVWLATRSNAFLDAFEFVAISFNALLNVYDDDLCCFLEFIQCSSECLWYIFWLISLSSNAFLDVFSKISGLISHI